jgi:hypothetical protein
MRCPGCGAEVPEVEELRSDHLYVGAAPGCWAAYTELTGRQLADPDLAEPRMLGVDVYMAQHPGVPGRQSSQSVWVHLAGLCLSLEHGFDSLASARAKARLAAPGATFVWLEPPASLGGVTVFDVLSAAPSEGRAAVRHWAESVWRAWEPHHDAIRQGASGLLDWRPNSRRRTGPHG